jgi:hypothetical protein
MSGETMCWVGNSSAIITVESSKGELGGQDSAARQRDAAALFGAEGLRVPLGSSGDVSHDQVRGEGGHDVVPISREGRVGHVAFPGVESRRCTTEQRVAIRGRRANSRA